MTKYTCTKCDNRYLKNNKVQKKFSHQEYLFTNDKNKCILHCQKDDWYEIDKKNLKSWDKSNDKVEFFWYKLDKYIKRQKGTCFIEEMIFPVFYISTTFTHEYEIKKNLNILFCVFLDKAVFQNVTFEGRLSLLFSEFKDEVIFNYCNFGKEVTCAFNLKLSKSPKFKNIELTFDNSKFNEKLLMYDLDLAECKLSFENVTFNNLVDFHNTTFGDVIFRNTKFNDTAVFVDCEFQKTLDFRNTIFKGEANFLDIVFAELSNRETARLIKHQFEKLNNKIEANKYHAFEMAQHRKDIKKKIFTDFKSFFKFVPDGLVSFVHWASSNHSSNWFLALFWIFIVSFATNFFLGNNSFDFSVNGWDNIFKYINILSKIEDFGCSYVAMTLNKVSLGYLYYQFVTAVRKDTRK